MTSERTALTGFWGGPSHRVVLLVVVLLLAIAFGPTMSELVHKWWNHSEYSHGFLMPIVAGWMVWERRSEIARLEPTPAIAGALLLVSCIGVLLIGEAVTFVVAKPFALVGSLAAVTWALYGRSAVRLAIAPLVALTLMCPLPVTFVNAVSIPLKGSAALLATGLLDLTGIQATLDGNLISLPGIEKLFVADACSGINSLISLTSLAIIVCLVWRRHWSLGAIVVLSCVPIAILTNGLRIWVTGVLSVEVGPETAKGFFHTFQGMALFGVGLAFLWGWAALLGRVFPGRDQ